MKSPPDYSLYLVTQESRIDDFDRIIQQAVEGNSMVQLRMKQSSARQMIEIGKKMLRFLKRLGIPLVINDRVDVAFAIQADGVHLGQSDSSVWEARAILGKEAIIGLSVETLDQARDAEHIDVDYLAASPVFPTKTKSDCSKPWGIEGLQQLCAFSSHPVIAIGGISLSNIEAVLKCGIQGIAIVSAIFEASDPKLAAQEFTKKIQEGILKRV